MSDSVWCIQLLQPFPCTINFVLFDLNCECSVCENIYCVISKFFNSVIKSGIFSHHFFERKTWKEFAPVQQKLQSEIDFVIYLPKTKKEIPT